MSSSFIAAANSSTAIRGLFGLLGCYYVYLIINGLRSGKMRYRYQTYAKDDTPLTFGFLLLMYAAAAGICLFLAFLGFSEM
jgi:hypothetical protein